MQPQTLLFAGLGTLAECAEADRQSWNAAFRAHGLGWEWSWDTYSELMLHGGDLDIVPRFAAFMGEAPPGCALETTRARLFAARLAEGIPLRVGVAQVLAWAANHGCTTAFVSRSRRAPVEALLRATARARQGIAFDTVVLRGEAPRHAPFPDGVEAALARLGADPAQTLAVADTPASASAALDAGLACVAMPGALAEGHAFPDGVTILDALSPAALGLSNGDRPQAAE